MSRKSLKKKKYFFGDLKYMCVILCTFFGVIERFVDWGIDKKIISKIFIHLGFGLNRVLYFSKDFGHTPVNSPMPNLSLNTFKK